VAVLADQHDLHGAVAVHVVPQAGDSSQDDGGPLAVAAHRGLLPGGGWKVGEALEGGQPVAFAAGSAALAGPAGRRPGVQGSVAAQPAGEGDPAWQAQGLLPA
jgi:hypothetical protein